MNEAWRDDRVRRTPRSIVARCVETADRTVLERAWRAWAALQAPGSLGVLSAPSLRRSRDLPGRLFCPKWATSIDLGAWSPYVNYPERVTFMIEAEPPDRIRMWTEAEPGVTPSVLIRNGQPMRLHPGPDPSRSARSDHREPPGLTVAVSTLLEPHAFLSAITVHTVAHSVTAGRQCTHVTCTADSSDAMPYWPAREFEFDLDDAYSVLLGVSAIIDGRIVGRATFDRIAFDGPIAPKRFEIA